MADPEHNHSPWLCMGEATMRVTLACIVLGIFGLAIAGCSSAPHAPLFTNLPDRPTSPDSPLVQTGYFENSKKDIVEPTPPGKLDLEAGSQPRNLPDLLTMTIDRNPRLAQVTWAVDAARGRALQSGLYPNPVLSAAGDEISDITGPGGIWVAPFVTQEFVTANKLGLSKAAALKEVDQATLTVVSERYRLFTDVRQNFFELVTLQRRVEILGELIELAEKSVQHASQLLKAKEASELDVVQLEFDLERYRADLEATNKMLPAAFRRMAASIGVNDLPNTPVVGDLYLTLPDYDLERLRVYILGIHPDVRSAQIGVEKAQLVLKRAMVEPVPNVSVGAGYVSQNQNKSQDWAIGASLPVPLWNRNQGNINAARAQVSEALNEVGRVENDIVNRLALSFTNYAAARKRAEKYKSAILPKAEQSYQLSLKAYQGGQFAYLRVLEAQRAVAEARLEYLRSLGEMWKSASEIAGLMLEDQWPVPPMPLPDAPERKQP